MEDKKNLFNLFGLVKRKEEKSVPAIEGASEITREGLPKTYIPKFLYKPPFGYPRFVDLPNVRRLAATPFVEMCITTIVDEISAVSWDIVLDDDYETNTKKEQEIKHVKSFFLNPNTNKESFEKIIRKIVRDILEIDAGVINKIFNLRGQMVEIVSRDGATFTKNPDIYGMFTNREDLIFDKTIIDRSEFNREARLMEPGMIHAADAREKAAYFQYGWITGARPVPLGKKEIVWLERNPRTDSVYGRGPVEILADSIQTLIYSIEHNLEYFNDNSIPKGIIGLDGSNTEEIKAFKKLWEEQQRVKDSAGLWKKKFHKVPIVNKIPKFERIQFSNAELELIQQQQWFAKMVWACFGVTATELGYTEDAKGLANQIVQSNIFRKRAINPILRLLEYHFNMEIVSEFEYEGIKFQFSMFDVEEETKKANLYKLQTEIGLKTVNEIRTEEGFDDVEWGDKPPKEWRGGESNINFNPFNPFQQEQARMEGESEEPSKEELEKEKEKKAFNCECIKCGHKLKSDEHCKDIKCPKCGGQMRRIERPGPGQKDIETKPFGEYADFAECVRKNKGKRNPEAYCASLHKKITGKWPTEKALSTQENPLILREFEVPDEDRLVRSIVYLIGQNKKKIKELIEKEIGKDKLSGIKSVNDIAEKIGVLVSFEGVKGMSDAVIKYTFLKGWNKMEGQINRNLMLNKEVVRFIQDYTFNNIKGMTDEITDDLRQELKRGIMAGEGAGKLKERVEKVFDVGANRAEMIARTETNRAQNQGQFQAFKSSGLDPEEYDKKWISVMDNRTSALCKRLHNQVVSMNENFKDPQGKWEGPLPPAHVDCRSGVIYIDKEQKEKKDMKKEVESLKEQKQVLKETIDVLTKKKEADILDKKEKIVDDLEQDLNAGN